MNRLMIMSWGERSSYKIYQKNIKWCLAYFWYVLCVSKFDPKTPFANMRLYHDLYIACLILVLLLNSKMCKTNQTYDTVYIINLWSFRMTYHNFIHQWHDREDGTHKDATNKGQVDNPACARENDELCEVEEECDTEESDTEEVERLRVLLHILS